MRKAFRPLVTLILSAWVVACPAAEQGPKRSVLLITIDTLRPDYLGAYGAPVETSPSIDALAARGRVFDHAIAAASLTAPAHASIMTSLYAREHSIGELNGETRLDEAAETLAERFRSEGYATAAFIGNVVLKRRSGLDRGFDVYDDELPHSEPNRPAHFERLGSETAARALAWLDARGDEPVFLWVHLQDPHGPYDPPEGFLGRIGHLPLRYEGDLRPLAGNRGRAGLPAYQRIEGVTEASAYAGRYAEEILFADHWVGEISRRFEVRAGEAGSVLLLTADHGESMGEDGFYFQHGQSTRPELAAIPLIVLAPGFEPGRSDAVVSHVDVAPTLLELAGLGPLAQSSGRSLVALMRGGEATDDRMVFCDIDGDAAGYARDRYVRAIGPGSTTRRPGAEPPPVDLVEWEARERKADGGWQHRPLDAADVERLKAHLADQVEVVVAGAMDPADVERLRALGYLDPDVDPQAGD